MFWDLWVYLDFGFEWFSLCIIVSTIVRFIPFTCWCRLFFGHISFSNVLNSTDFVLSCFCNFVSADVMKSLNIPRGVRRVLFRTLNTDRYIYELYSTLYFGVIIVANECHGYYNFDLWDTVWMKLDFLTCATCFERKRGIGFF